MRLTIYPPAIQAAVQDVRRGSSADVRYKVLSVEESHSRSGVVTEMENQARGRRYTKVKDAKSWTGTSEQISISLRCTNASFASCSFFKLP
jgi:hypothetical protein